MGAKKPWSGRLASRTDTVVEEFTASISFDHVLYKYDIRGSIAHCRMLSKQKIIPLKEARKIIKALKEIEKELERGVLELGHGFEDIHMLIESRLIEKVGPAGGKLHTARSRNDQVALDVSLYLRDAVLDIIRLIDRLQQGLLNMAEKNMDVFMPGFTHLQHAQPVLFSHHLMAYFEMLNRDGCRMQSCYSRANRMPLGAGALAGTPHPVDRQYVAGLLGYPEVTANSMDTVSDRDTLIEFCSSSAIIMMHLSRFCEELILWSSSEFQFIEISDSFCTGSSIMPQKKNPDVPELVRGKTGRVYGNLMSLLTLMKSLPLSYNRDLQEDKVALFDTVETTRSCLNIFSLMLPEIKVNKQKMAQAAQSGFLTATDLADYLAGKGIPFRTAHEIVGRIVLYCMRKKKTLPDLKLEELQKFSTAITQDALKQLTIETSINNRKSFGATGKQAVKRAFTRARAELRRRKRFINQLRN
jgi:argininosuccinate lyase